MPALTETIAQEFLDNGVKIDQVYAGRVQDLAEMYNFTAEEMVCLYMELFIIKYKKHITYFFIGSRRVLLYVF